MAATHKKTRELAILQMVYHGGRGLFIEDNERPDFLIRLSKDDQAFGVEVAEFFHSQSQARLDRLPGYTERLLSGGDLRHKDDRNGFTVSKVNVIAPDDTVVLANEPAIIQQMPTRHQWAGVLAGILRRKDERLDASFRKLKHINLVVMDRTGSLRQLKPEKFYATYCTGVLRQSLFSSRFREVYFVTRFSNGPAFIPLKMLATLAQLYFFHAVVQAPELLSQVDSVDHLMRWFGAYLRSIVVGEVYVRPDADATEVLYADTGLMVGEDLSLRVRSYQDFPFPQAEPVSDGTVRVDPTVFERVATFQEANTFAANIAFPIEATTSEER